MYRREYGGDGVVLKSKVSLDAYFPRKDLHYVPEKPYKVFFYARPNMPRNAFELGIAGLKRLKQDLGDDVEIITAGEAWDPMMYGVQGMFTNLGKIDYNAVPKLYRSVDAGLMFMFSGHPGVTASELMASGCPVVVNEYDDVTWHELYQHEKTCLVTMASASEVARNLKRCLTESELRRTLIDNGLEKVASFYSGYDESLVATTRALIGE
jgi:glycosyltransferase involved in cell wall biosynthesis